MIFFIFKDVNSTWELLYILLFFLVYISPYDSSLLYTSRLSPCFENVFINGKLSNAFGVVESFLEPLGPMDSDSREESDDEDDGSESYID